jgi:hypothetical protein
LADIALITRCHTRQRYQNVRGENSGLASIAQQYSFFLLHLLPVVVHVVHQSTVIVRRLWFILKAARMLGGPAIRADFFCPN